MKVGCGGLRRDGRRNRATIHSLSRARQRKWFLFRKPNKAAITAPQGRRLIELMPQKHRRMRPGPNTRILGRQARQRWFLLRKRNKGSHRAGAELGETNPSVEAALVT